MKKILVADDSVTIQKVIALTFADEPFEVQSVGTGAEALELMNKWKPDVLLADVIMPQMNGYELCRAVKEQAETSSVPVLLLAGTFEAFDEEEAKSVGADGYVTKPFESGELIEKVNTLVGSLSGVEPAPEPHPELSPEEVREAGTPHAEPPPLEPIPMEPTLMESPQEDLSHGKPPEVEPLQMDADEAPFADIPELGEIEQVSPEPVQKAETEGEPDIWDILSDTRDAGGAPEGHMAGAAVPGMGLTEDRSVIDFGSFDVGLDRPEPAATPAESRAEADVEKPFVSAEPDDVQPVPDKPVESPIAYEPPVSHAEQPDQLSAEKSRVEDREKDFFGFETEGPEIGGEEEFLGDAIEEITFDMDESVTISGDEKPEVSFAVPEPDENKIPVTGETLSPEAQRPGQTIREEEAQTDEETSPPTFIPKPIEDAEPSVLKEEAVYDMPARPVFEVVPGPQTPEPEGALEPEAIEDLGTGQPSEKAPLEVTQEPSVDEIRRIVEEKVEKVVWEVVPELAEVLIREAIEKIKGKP